MDDSKHIKQNQIKRIQTINGLLKLPQRRTVSNMNAIAATDRNDMKVLREKLNKIDELKQELKLTKVG